MNILQRRLNELHTLIIYAEKSNSSISSVNVGWHIEHSLLVIMKIIESVCKSDPKKYKWSFSFIRTIVFLRKRFPRGKGIAPDVVKPKQTEKTDFDELFTKAKIAIEDLKNANPNQFFLHPVFGNLNRKNTFTMLEIHTKHHIEIIKDIISIK